MTERRAGGEAAAESGRARVLRIRPLDAGEATALAAIAERLFRETYVDEYHAADMEDYIARSFGPAHQLAELTEEGACVLVVEDDAGEPLGFAHLRDRAAPVPAAARRPRELVRFYVDRRWHGHGVAGRLMDACVADALARGADVLWLAVWQENRRAIAFYAKHGFEVRGTQTFRFGVQVDEDWVMVRPTGGEPSPPASVSEPGA